MFLSENVTLSQVSPLLSPANRLATSLLFQIFLKQEVCHLGFNTNRNVCLEKEYRTQSSEMLTRISEML